MRFRRSRALLASPTTLFALLFLTTATVVSAGRETDTINFSSYPANAQDCMYDASDASNCASGKTVPKINACFCNNGGNFLTASAFCINKKDKNSMQKTYDTLKTNCGGTETPLSISEKDWLAAKDPNGGSTTTTSAKTSTSATSTGSTSTSSTSSPTATQTNTNNDEGMSSTAKIGIIAGASVAGVAILVGAGVFIWKRRRNHHDQDESHPMLAGGPGPRTSAMSTGQAGDWARDAERDAKWPPTPGTDYRNSHLDASTYAPSDVTASPHQSWGYNPTAPYTAAAALPGQQQLSPYHSPHVGQMSPPLVAPGMTHQPPAPIAPPQPAVFELGGGEGVATGGPAEMPASPLDGMGAQQRPPQTGAAPPWAPFRPSGQ